MLFLGMHLEASSLLEHNFGTNEIHDQFLECPVTTFTVMFERAKLG